MRPTVRSCFLVLLGVGLIATSGVATAKDFFTWESGPVRPITLSPDGSQLFVTNIPDNRLEIFSVSGGGITFVDSVPVGLEPVAVAARNNNEVWVVNHLSDSVSIVDLTSSPPRVKQTLLVGDEPRDIIFAGTGNGRAFITTAHRGQHLTHASISGVTGAGDPQLTTEGIGRADVWVFTASAPGTAIGGTPVEILTFFADTPRALAKSPDGNTVYVAAFHSGNQSTVINELDVPDGFDSAGPSGGAPGGIVGPDENALGQQANGKHAPETGIIVKYDGSDWLDHDGRDWSSLVNFNLPDHDVFSINANTLAPGSIDEFASVGTILFNMAVNPVNGKIYVTNTESPNNVRFEGPGDHGGTTVQGHLSESRITVIDPSGPSVDPQHLNQHIEYDKLHTDTPDLVNTSHKNHSLATPLQPVVSSDGNTLYVAAFGSAKIGVFDTSDIEDASFESNFDPTTESANYLSTGGGPAGLALDETYGRLYVLTRFDNMVRSINTTTGSELQAISLMNPEPSNVVTGRPFLYDAFNTSGNGEASCASCHIFADFDSLAWNLGNPDDETSENNQPSAIVLPGESEFHPMKGPMTTQTLRGLATHGALHWRGDRLDGHFGEDLCNNALGTAPCDEDHSFNNFIVAFEGLVGLDGILPEADMLKFTSFALEILSPPNPIRNLDNSLTTDQANGAADFLVNGTDGLAGTSCQTCHRHVPKNGFFGSGGRQTFENEPQNFKVAGFKNVYSKVGMFGNSNGGPHTGDQVRGVGMLHDGSVDTVFNFLQASVFNSLNNSQRSDLEAFVLAFDTDVAPIVGQQVTLTSTNSGVVDPRIDLMIARASTNYDSIMAGGNVPECDVIVKGSVGTAERGWKREPGGTFSDDVGGSISDAALRALAVTEGPLTYTCAPPGTGLRAGIERDGDGLLDGVETGTGVFVNASDTGTHAHLADSDGDGFDDGVEVAAGTDPNDPSDPAFAPSVPSMAPLGLAGLGLMLTVVGVAVAGRRRRS